MLNYLYVAIGSAVGGVARFIVGSWLQRRLDDWAPRAGALPFPIGTLIVNVTGSFLLGALVVIIARQSGAANATRLLLAVGFCGGYTTFSTFSYDTVALLEGGAPSLASLNIMASLGLAFVATFCGMVLTRALLTRSI
jgi:CrcB protein